LYSNLDSCSFLQFFVLCDKVEEDEAGGTCGTNGGEEERVKVIGRKARGKETTRKTET
jgi:hypothetical protein